MPRLLTALALMLNALYAPAAERVVSLDYCADQFVLEFVERSRITALSPDATRSFSYLRDKAVGIPSLRPLAEDILIAKPDLVVRSYGGGADIARFLGQFDIPVVQLGYAGSLQDIKYNVLAVSAALGNSQHGVRIVTDMERRLAKIATANQNRGSPATLYMTPTGVTSGPGTIVHELIITAGLGNYQTQAGWHQLPLERLVYQSPDVVALAFFESLTNHANAWSATRHPIAQRQLELAMAIPLQGAWTACGGWFLLDAIDALSRANLIQHD